jgi:hypothetical protein
MCSQPGRFLRNDSVPRARDHVLADVRPHGCQDLSAAVDPLKRNVRIALVTADEDRHAVETTAVVEPLFRMTVKAGPRCSAGLAGADERARQDATEGWLGFALSLPSIPGGS